jgi:hypothetical protein
MKKTFKLNTPNKGANRDVDILPLHTKHAMKKRKIFTHFYANLLELLFLLKFVINNNQ